MRIEQFDYTLPPELIAQEPCETREGSRLLVVDSGGKTFDHRRFVDLPEYLSEGDCLVFNASRVRHARLMGRKAGSGGKVEVLLLRRRDGEVWEALARPYRRLRGGEIVNFGRGELEAEVVSKSGQGVLLIRLRAPSGEDAEKIIERLGEVPLPPYIKEELQDGERYQTVYANDVGSAAAPTAGLHFELSTLRGLEKKGVKLAFLHLNVGLDTFRPIQEEEVELHHMHAEEMVIDAETCMTINSAHREGRRVVAVGTTVVRALESAQEEGELKAYRGPTDLFIYPGFRFGVVDALVTNFHMPRSSLLVLVCAFAGRELVLEAYRRAVEERYRFLSFGDACYFHNTGSEGRIP